MAPPPDVLPGPKTPHWGCSCGCWDNWASRIKCRQCGASAPTKVVNAAKKASQASPKGPKASPVRSPQGKWANGGPSSGPAAQARLIKDLQDQVAALTARSQGVPDAGGGKPQQPASGQPAGGSGSAGDGFQACVAFLRAQGAGVAAIQAVEAEGKKFVVAPKPKAYTSQSARWKCENLRKKIQKLEQRKINIESEMAKLDVEMAEVVQSAEQARQELAKSEDTLCKALAQEFNDPFKAVSAGLDSSVVESHEGQAALATLQRLQVEAAEKAKAAAASSAGADSPSPAQGQPGAQGSQQQGSAPTVDSQQPGTLDVDFTDAEFQAALKRALDSEDGQARAAELIVARVSKAPRRV